MYFALEFFPLITQVILHCIVSRYNGMVTIETLKMIIMMIMVIKKKMMSREKMKAQPTHAKVPLSNNVSGVTASLHFLIELVMMLMIMLLAEMIFFATGATCGRVKILLTA